MLSYLEMVGLVDIYVEHVLLSAPANNDDSEARSVEVNGYILLGYFNAETVEE